MEENIVVKNVTVYLRNNDGTSLKGDATFDSVKEVISLDCSDENRYELDDGNEVFLQIPYSSVLYWAMEKEDAEDDTETDEKVTKEEFGKAKQVNFFNKMFGGR